MRVEQRRRLIALLVALLLPPLIVVLYSVKPVETSIYPPCLFFSLSGLHCPGCGTTRCLHALLHGRVLQAIAYNAVILALLPFFIYWGAGVWCAAIRGRKSKLRPTTWSISLVFFILLAFWILRNVPYFPFHYLAPHDL